MANTNLPKGFKLANMDFGALRKYKVNASDTITDGDVLYMGTDGYATVSRVAGYILGIAVGSIIDGISGANNASASATDGEDYILVADDPNQIMIAQITTGAETDKYTTGSSATCFDVAGATGVQYIDAAASAQDEIKVLTAANEPNGSESAVGAYRKVFCRFNVAKHVYGTLA